MVFVPQFYCIHSYLQYVNKLRSVEKCSAITQLVEHFFNKRGEKINPNPWMQVAKQDYGQYYGCLFCYGIRSV